MKSLEVKALGLEELSIQESLMISGGETVICHYDGSNRLFYAINAVANGVKYVKHWITGDELYVTTIHDDGTRDEPIPYPN